MEFDPLFVEPIGEEQEAFLKEDVRQQRVRQLVQATQEAARRRAEGRPVGALNGYLAGVSALLGSDHARGLELVDHWETSFFLPTLLDDAARSRAASARLMMGLLFERLSDGGSPVEGQAFHCTTDSDGALYAFARDGRIRLRRLARPDTELTWRGARNSVLVQPQGEAEGSGVEVGLPLATDGSDPEIEFLPFDRSECWGVPLIDRAQPALLLDEEQPGLPDSRPEQSDQGPVLPLSASLTHAYRILLECWSDVLPWAKALIPAFVEIGSPAKRTTRLSGSYGPGMPVYLSKVTDPFAHAEDIVHELQHLRFHQLVGAEREFGGWTDAQKTFVSPYRPDPRPIRGVHLGLHAFVAVNELRLRALDRIRSESKIREMLTAHRSNLFAFRTIVAAERLTGSGRNLYERIGRALLRHDAAIEPLAPKVVVGRVEEELREHIAAVAARDGGVQNAGTSYGAGQAEELLQLESAPA